MRSLDVGDASDPHGLAAYALRYLDSLRIRHYSDNTIEGRTMLLRFFICWCEERGLTRPAEITRAIVESYQRWMAVTYRTSRDKTLGIPTQLGRIKAISGFFRWLARHGHISYNPVADLERPRCPRPLPASGFSVVEMENIFAQAKVDQPVGLRDRAILEALYSTAMRRFELAKLRTWDIDADAGTAMIREGKYRKGRLVPIGERALAWIERYQRDARPRLVVPPDDGFLFLTARGGPFGFDWLSIMVREYIVQAGFGTNRRGSCHLFRHSCATHMLERGADIRHVQEILGHDNLTSTQIYTRVAIAHLVAVHAATHPMSPKAPREPVVPMTTQLHRLARLLVDDSERGDGGREESGG